MADFAASIQQFVDRNAARRPACRRRRPTGKCAKRRDGRDRESQGKKFVVRREVERKNEVVGITAGRASALMVRRSGSHGPARRPAVPSPSALTVLCSRRRSVRDRRFRSALFAASSLRQATPAATDHRSRAPEGGGSGNSGMRALLDLRKLPDEVRDRRWRRHNRFDLRRGCGARPPETCTGADGNNGRPRSTIEEEMKGNDARGRP